MKTRNAIIAMILLLSLFVTGCKPTDVPATEPSNPSLEPTAPDIENLSLYEKLPYLVAEAYNMVETTEILEIERTLYVYRYIVNQEIATELTTDEETGKEIYKIPTKENKDQLVYLVFLHILTTEYQDCVYFMDEYRYYHPYEFSGGSVSYVLFVYDQYGAAGYENAKAYYQAMEADECGYPPDALKMRFDSNRIHLYTDWWSKNELFSDLLAAVNNGK